VAARGLIRPGDRVLVEAPGYPNAPRSFAAAGARLVGITVDDAGWDLDLLTGAARGRPRAAYLVPDFHNPTGHLLDDAGRRVVARALARAGTVAVVDECLQPLALEGQAMPRPLAAHVEEAGGHAISVGGASKAIWGGLRVGWLRAPTSLVDRLAEARLTLDLGVPVVEQLATVHLLERAEDTLTVHRERLRAQRDVLAAALSEALPDWTFRLPGGGLALWCALPAPLAVPLAEEAERLGILISPGPVFAPEGGYAARVRVPYTRPTAELERAVTLLAQAWAATTEPSGDRPRRPLVA
jgi:DNA-binding transcriptional MocR family regulator